MLAESPATSSPVLQTQAIAQQLTTQQTISYQAAARSANNSLRLVAHMLGAINTAVPARSIATRPIQADGCMDGPSIVLRTGHMPASPPQLRREYAMRYERSDPLHPRLVADSREILVCTRDIGGFQGLRSSLFGEYVEEQGLAYIMRMFLRSDSRLVCSLFLGRTRAQGEFTDREVECMRNMHPFLQEAYLMATRRVPETEREDLLHQAGLSMRETEVARFAASGLRSREIGERLFLTEATVKTHLAHIYTKLGVRTRTELAARLRPLEG
jgi:DNA-binding CsgD family transcriptional regulator